MDYKFSFADYYGRIGNRHPAAKRWDFLKQPEFVIVIIVPPSPMLQAKTYFIDRSFGDIGKVRGPDIHHLLVLLFPSPTDGARCFDLPLTIVS